VVPEDVTTTNAGSWPAEGAIEFEAVNMRYRAGLPLVLRNLNLAIGGGLRVGVCGRSGSGKSSLLVALFRMAKVEPAGRILIDGVDIASLSLRQLRRTVGIIPQDPVLFVGTLRDNLDAFGEHTDAELWDALRCAALDGSEMEEQHPGGLAAKVDEGGSNWSTGQRQLICLARVVLRQPKVLAIDEATANIDLVTDAIVQKSIRTQFAGATCLTIAHRLQTILDSDLIVTMDAGRVAEVIRTALHFAAHNKSMQLTLLFVLIALSSGRKPCGVARKSAFLVQRSRQKRSKCRCSSWHDYKELKREPLYQTAVIASIY